MKLDGVAWQQDGPRSAPVLLALHSLGWNAEMWAPQLSAWTDLRRVIRVDLPGHGQSTAASKPDSIATLAADAVAILDRLGVERFDVCGLSLGGQVALQIASDHPNRVRSLVACATAARIGNPEVWNARISQVSKAGMAGVVDQVVEQFFSVDFRVRSPADIKEARAAVLATNPDGYIGCCEALRNADLSAGLARIEAPALLLAGEKDVSTPESVMRNLSDQLPKSRLVVLPNVGHILNREAPRSVAQLAIDHLRKYEATGRSRR